MSPLYNPASGATPPFQLEDFTDAARDAILPSLVIAQNMPRGAIQSPSAAPLASGRLQLVGGIVLPGSELVTPITFISGTTAASVPTNQWFALYRQSDRVLIRQTTNDTTAAWAANTAKTLNLSSTYTPTDDEPVWVGVMVAATTPPGFCGLLLQNTAAITGIASVYSGTSNTGLTTTAPDPANAPTGGNAVPYCYVS